MQDNLINKYSVKKGTEWTTEFAFSAACNFVCNVSNANMDSNVSKRLSTIRYNCIAISAYLTTTSIQETLSLFAKGKKYDYLEGIFLGMGKFKPVNI